MIAALRLTLGEALLEIFGVPLLGVPSLVQGSNGLAQARRFLTEPKHWKGSKDDKDQPAPGARKFAIYFKTLKLGENAHSSLFPACIVTQIGLIVTGKLTPRQR